MNRSVPALLAMLLVPFAGLKAKVNQFAGDARAQLNVQSALGIAAGVITAVVAVVVVAALAPTYFTELASLTGTFNDVNTTTGDTTADGLLPIFGLLIAFGGLFAIVGLALVIVKVARRSG